MRDAIMIVLICVFLCSVLGAILVGAVYAPRAENKRLEEFITTYKPSVITTDSTSSEKTKIMVNNGYRIIKVENQEFVWSRVVELEKKD